MAMLKIKNWEKFQHYKDRNPPWIKLSTSTFQDYDFACLQDASKLLALCIWTLASRYDGENFGCIPDDFEYVKRQGNLGDFVTIEHWKELVNQGFIIGDSKMLASCKQSARPETEGETKTKNISDDDINARVREIFSWCEKRLNSANPLFSSPINAWLTWGADFEADIKPAVEWWLKKNPNKPIRSLSWLDDAIAASIATRNKPQPTTEPYGKSTGSTSMPFTSSLASKAEIYIDRLGNKLDPANPLHQRGIEIDQRAKTQAAGQPLPKASWEF